jgi:ubiquinone biosynthesis accessory factor UbiK
MVRCHLTPIPMNKASLLNELQSKIGQLMQQSPAADLEKNLKALMSQGFAKLDLLTREEFDVQSEVLARTRAKLEQLEARVAVLEGQKKS